MRIACLLPAAGGGSRFGGRKQLAPIDGKPMLRHCLEILAPRFGDDLFTVLGAYRDETRPLADDLACVIEHEQWQDGLGSSIAAGVRAIEDRGQYDGILLTLADQVALTDDDFARLVDPFDGRRIVAAYYSRAPGVPAIFPRSLFARLRRLEGDRGAKPLLLRLQPRLRAVPLPAAARDIDRLADLGAA